MTEKTVKMNDKGMITIPNAIRKKYQWKEGSEFVVLELEGKVTIIPIFALENLPKISRDKYLEIYESSHKEELEMEK